MKPGKLVAACATCCVMAQVAAADAVGQPVKISDLGVLADAPFYVALEKGYFADAKIEVQVERFGSAQQAVAPLSTNQIQVVGGAVSAALFNAFARDWPVRIVMARTRDIPGYSGNALAVREDLRPKVSSIASLKGMKIAINAPAASLHYMLGKMLATGGLALSDVQLVYMSWPDMAVAFGTKAIDAGTTVEPFTLEFEDRKISFTLSRSADLLTSPPMEVAVLLYNKQWTDQKPEQARAFSLAYLRGARDYVDALKGGAKRAEVISIMTKYTPRKDPKQYDRMGWTWMDPNGEVSIAGLREQQDWYAAQGAVKTKIAIESVIDRSFLDYALEKLGRVDAKP